MAGIVPEATRILEIGTGTGRTGHEALRSGFREYVGVEPTTALAKAAEMMRVTRPGGSILIAAPDIRDFGAYFWDSDWSHGWPTTPRRVAQVLRDLGLDVVRESSMHLGGLGPLHAFAAHLASAVIPTRLVDMATVKVVGRPLASGLKIATLWGLVFVVACKPLAEKLTKSSAPPGNQPR